MPVTERGDELREVVPDRVDIAVDTHQAAWAYLADSATPLPPRIRAGHVAAR